MNWDAIGHAAGNLLMKSDKLAAAGRAVKAIAKLTQGTMGVCAGIETARTGFTNLLNGLEAGTFDRGAFLQTLGSIGIALLSGKGMVSSGRDLLACEEGLSQLWNSARSKVSKGIRDFANDNRGYVDLDALGITRPKKDAILTVDDLIDSSVKGRITKGRSTQYERVGNYQNAVSDFNSLYPQNVREMPNGKGYIGQLSDGRTNNVRNIRSEGVPTIEVQKGKNKIKFRYKECK